MIFQAALHQAYLGATAGLSDVKTQRQSNRFLQGIGGRLVCQCCAGRQPDEAQMDKYKRITFLSMIPVPVLQQAAWLSLAIDENRPQALLCFLFYSWPLFLRPDLVGQENFRLPFLATFIISFIHMQHELYGMGAHPLIAWLGKQAKEEQKGRADAQEEDMEQEVLRIEECRVRDNMKDEAIFDKRLVLRGLKVENLKELAREHKIKGRSKMRKAELIANLEARQDIMEKIQEDYV